MAKEPEPSTWDQARTDAYSAASQMAVETLPISEAVGRVVPDALSSPIDLPPTPTSAMDGWAVCGVGPWQVIGESLAGETTHVALTPGQAIGIATGAEIPTGAEAVVRSEAGTLESDSLTAEGPEADQFIRPAATECQLGDELIPDSTVLRPQHLGLLSAVGLDDVDVVCEPAVQILTLGDELLAYGPPHDGKIRDSLGPMLPAWLAEWGAQFAVGAPVPDNYDAVLRKLRASVAAHDITITTGGTAAGPVDFLVDAIAELSGEYIVRKVHCRPGHHMMMARVPNGNVIVALPGNPLSAVVGLYTLVLPYLAGLLGLPSPRTQTIELTEELTSKTSEVRLVIGHADNGRFTASPYQGSAMLRGLSFATGFAVLPPSDDTAAAGQLVEYLPIARDRASATKSTEVTENTPEVGDNDHDPVSEERHDT